MSKSKIAGKSSRGTSWQHQAAASSLHKELSATHASGDVKDPNTESMPSFQQASTSETAGYWRNAVQAVSKGKPFNSVEPRAMPVLDATISK